jgi:hypothetical protein
MSHETDAEVHLPSEVDSELDRALSMWATARRLRPAELATIRAQVLARVSAEADASRPVESESRFDADWLWSLLRPVSRLMESAPETGEENLAARIERWLQPLTVERVSQPYLRLT